MQPYITMLQIRENAILIYDQPRQKKTALIDRWKSKNMKEIRATRYKGFLSAGAKKRLAKATSLLCQSAKKHWIYNEVSKRYFSHRLSFITLTVSDPTQKLTAKDAYKNLLSHFLQWLRRTKNCKTYIWKAELQQNGQIHYHITTPSFINYQEIRNKWNFLQRRNGLLEKYHADKGHYNPNSTDIHEVIDIQNMAAYLIKYITKESQNKNSLGGKIWDCSENLKINTYYTTELSGAIHTRLETSVAQNQATTYTGERFTIYKFKTQPAEKMLSPSEYLQYKEFLTCIRQGEKYIVNKFNPQNPLGIAKEQIKNTQPKTTKQNSRQLIITI